MTDPRARKKSLRTHQGRVLVDLVADKYHSLTQALVEMAQNGIDAQAERIFIGIDLASSRIIVLDDGTGITEDKFDEALVNVGNSIKHDEGSIGRFGLGLIAPLNKCREYRVISRPLGTGQVLEWLMIGEEIRKQYDPEIEMKVLEKAPLVHPAFRELAGTLVHHWRTMILITDITMDRTIGAVEINELARQIRTKLGRGMRRQGTRIYLALIDQKGATPQQKQVDTLDYTGEPLAVAVYDEPECGKVVFRLYRAPKQGKARRGEVHVLRYGDVAAVAWPTFYIQAVGSRWLAKDNPTIKEAFDALGSGEFEGEIQIEHAVLDPDREKFVMNDALRYTYMVIEQWWVAHGKKLFENVREERQDERYVELGEQVLDELYRHLMTNAAFVEIAPHLFGGMSAEGVEEPEPEHDSEPEEKTGGRKPSRSRRRAVAKPPGDRDDDESQSTPRDPSEPEGRAPMRLRFAYDRVPGQTELWKLDRPEVTIVFNISHPEWERCDESGGKRTARHDRQVMHLQKIVALRVCEHWADYPDPEDFEAMRYRLDEHIPRYVTAFILS